MEPTQHCSASVYSTAGDSSLPQACAGGLHPTNSATGSFHRPPTPVKREILTETPSSFFLFHTSAQGYIER